jgi:hypothetical protein
MIINKIKGKNILHTQVVTLVHGKSLSISLALPLRNSEWAIPQSPHKTQARIPFHPFPDAATATGDQAVPQSPLENDARQEKVTGRNHQL